MSNVRHNHLSTERIQAFLDGDVPSRERRRVEEHLGSCARCAEELATWRVLFEDLDELRSHRPSTDFHSRVMSGVRVPVELPVAARVRAWLASLLPGDRPEHLGAGLLQDLAEGALTARSAARARVHVEGCTVCSAELESWTAVLTRLSELDRFAPGEHFAEAVIAGLRPATAGATAVSTAAPWVDLDARPVRSQAFSAAHAACLGSPVRRRRDAGRHVRSRSLRSILASDSHASGALLIRLLATDGPLRGRLEQRAFGGALRGWLCRSDWLGGGPGRRAPRGRRRRCDIRRRLRHRDPSPIHKPHRQPFHKASLCFSVYFVKPSSPSA